MLRSPTRLKFKDCKTAQKLSVGSSRGHQLLPPKSEMLQTVNIVKYCRLICGGWSGCLQPSISQGWLLAAARCDCAGLVSVSQTSGGSGGRPGRLPNFNQKGVDGSRPPVHVSKYPCARCWISICPDIHRSVCVTKDWFVYHDHHPQYNPVSPVTPDFIFYLFAFWINF